MYRWSQSVVVICRRSFAAPPGLALVLTVLALWAVVGWPADRAQADTMVTTCTTAGIQAALNAGGVVTFDCGTVPIVITPTLVVSGAVTIDGGNQTTLDGGGLTRIVSVTTGSTVTLTNITLQNGNALDGDNGGAVRVAGTARLLSHNAVFTNNRALAGSQGMGGAIFAEPAATIVLSGSTVANNRAANGGGILASTAAISGSLFSGNRSDIDGGGAFVGGLATVTSTTFVSNAAGWLGGGIRFHHGTIAGSMFASNSAMVQGGGIDSSGWVDLIGTTIISNTANFGGGGGVSGPSLTITLATIGYNRSGTAGGGVSAGSLFIRDSVVISNSAGDSGGGVLAFETTVLRTTIVQNQAVNDGGGIRISGSVVVSDSQILSNAASLGKGGGVWGGDVLLAGSSLVGNSAQVGGGSWSDTATVERSILVANWASAGGGVGTESALTVTQSTILSNTATSGDGGGLYSNGTAVVTRSTILTNFASSRGGGLYAGGDVAITSTRLSSNRVYGAGGGTFAKGTLTLRDSPVTENFAGLGAGLWASGMLEVIGSTLAHNESLGAGGGALVNSATFVNSTIVNNTSAANGGAVRFWVSLALTNTTVMSNGTNTIMAATASLPFTITDSIIGGSGAPLCSQGASSLVGTNLVQDGSCGITATTGLLLGPLQDNGGPTLTMAPLPGSPAIGATGACLPTDQRGALRSTPCDVGAYETGAAPILLSLSPAALPALDPGFVLTITGNGFLPGTVALWNGSPRPTVIVSTTVLTAAIPSADLAASGQANVQARYRQAADSVSNSLPFTITKLTQTITFGPIADRTVGDLSFVLSATASSGLTVAFTAVGACSVGDSTVTLTGAGICTITAVQAGNAIYLAAPPVARVVTIAPASFKRTVVTLPAVSKEQTLQ